MKRFPARLSRPLLILPAYVVLGLALQGCAGSPAAPDALASSATAASPDGASAATTSGWAATFQLLNGTFHLVGAGGAIDGTYTGEASVGRLETATLQLLVTNGSGTFSGAAGSTLSGTGKGVFTGEGPFSLTVAGRLTTAGSGEFQFRVALDGTSTVSCTAGIISVTQNGTGSGPKVGSATTTFQHQVSDTACS